jgi:hypothetical protein
MISAAYALLMLVFIGMVIGMAIWFIKDYFKK